MKGIDKFKRGLESILSNPENKLQQSIVTYIKLAYPKVLVHYNKNEEQNKVRRKANIELGILVGIPDLVIMTCKNNAPYTFYIELKAGYNKPTDKQLETHSRLKNLGFKVYVGNNFDDLKTIIDNELQG